MSNEIRVELNSDGVRELLKSPEIMGTCKSLANGIAGRAGSGYIVTTYTGVNRVNASVCLYGGSKTGQPEEQYSAEGGEGMITLIEATVIGYLMSTLQTDDVYAERPIAPPDEYYIVEKTAADEVNHIQRATVAVQSISKLSLLDAATMSKAVEKAMKNIISVSDISKCKLNSAYNFTNQETKEYRYQAVFDIYYMEGD